jgi:acyl dehydratase
MSGKYYDQLQVGQRFKHSQSRTITEMDNVLFCALTMNDQPLHINEDFASKTPFGQRIVNGIFTLGLVIGLTISDLTEGTILANLGYESVRHPNPVFHGDTIYVESEVLEKRPSRSRPEYGIVRLKHVARNQDGLVVVEVERSVMFQRAPEEKSPNIRTE